MGGANGSALEWALALHRAPMERHTLRQKPLPMGLGKLLGIAAGAMPDALSEAAHAFGESEAKVREAAQFYVREVLFFPQATAYRVLGVNADASAEQIKTHHRVLQHWLHPDRLKSEGDAVFAARVNGAWNQLRNPERRQAYDQALREHLPPGGLDSNGLPRSARAWVANDDIHRPHWPRYLPMLLLLLTCLILILFVALDMSRSPDAEDWSDRSESTSVGDLVNISVPRRAEPVPVRPNFRASTKPKQSKKSVLGSRETRTPAPALLRPLTSGDRLAGIAPAMPAPALERVSKTVSPVRVQKKTTQSATRRIAPELPVEESAPSRSAMLAVAIASAPGFTKIQLARRTGDQLLRYMEVVDLPPPPVWNSPAIQSSADQLRQALHAQGRPRLGVAHWRIGNETAVLTSGYTMQGNGDRNDKRVGNGLLTADLLWRNGQWLVTGLSVEREQ